MRNGRLGRALASTGMALVLAAGCQLGSLDSSAGGEPAVTGGARAMPQEAAGAAGQGAAVHSPANPVAADCSDHWEKIESPGIVRTTVGRTTYSNHGDLPRPSANGPTYPSCGDSPLRGAQRVYRLDLEQQSSRFNLYAAVDAEFEAALVIGRGDCADLEDLTCALGVKQPKQARLTAELDPGQYFIVVRGVGLESYGSYELQVHIEPLGADCHPASNKDCASATPLSTQGHVLRTYLPVDCDYEATDDVQESRFYQIDLRAEPGITGLHAQLEFLEEAAPEDPDTEYPMLQLWNLDTSGACSATEVAPRGLFWEYGRSVSTALAPGLYALELESPPARPAYLRVEFNRPDCSGNVHDTCANAEDIQLTGEQATVRGHTYCGREQYARENCVEPSPKRFYRLDLRDRKDRVRLRAKIPPRDLGFYAAVTLLRDDGPNCDALLLQCFDSLGSGDGWPLVDSIVEPGVYFLVVEGVELGAAGEFTLEVDISDWRTKRYYGCYGGDVEGCLYNTNDAADVCWRNPLHESCRTMFTSCGLSFDVQDCVCDSDPVCCDGGEEDAERCAPVFTSCGFFCEDVGRASPFIGWSRLFSLLYGD